MQIRAEAAYLYDAVHLYAKGIIGVLKMGGSPRNGSLIIEQIKGQQYLSAMGYMVQIDENADASGNYTLLKLSNPLFLDENGSGPLTFGLVPVGTFGAMDDKNKLPVSVTYALPLFALFMTFYFLFFLLLFTSSTSSSLMIFIGWGDDHLSLCHSADFEGNCVSVSINLIINTNHLSSLLRAAAHTASSGWDAFYVVDDVLLLLPSSSSLQ